MTAQPTPWYADWRYWLAGAATLTGVWGVECLRKGDLMWPWPLVPLAIWAAILIMLRFLRSLRSRGAGA